VTESSDDDDPQLRALRAVWLTLPDQDPPQRGLAELMAAARAHAEVMARPSWWRRLLDALRRPSVLALATVVLLIGGALFVSQHDRALAPTPERAPANAGPAGATPVETTLPPAAPPSVTSPEPVLVPPAEPAKDHLAVDHVAPPKATVATVRPHVAPRADTAKLDPAVVDTGASDRRKTVELQQHPGGTGSGGFAAGSAQIAADDVVADRKSKADATTTTTQAESLADRGEAEAPIRTTNVTKTPARPPAPPVTQLFQQCRSAATRGDCAVVRMLASRIAKQDAGFYRERVVKDGEITKCIAPSPPAAAAE
jgi:hypothetical protein